MKKLLSWVKANPLVMASIVLTVAAIGGLTYAFLVRQSITATLNQWDTALFQQTKTLKNTRIEIPPPTPGAPIVVNYDYVTPGVIEHRKNINAEFAKQQASVFDQVNKINNAQRQLSAAFQNSQMVGQTLGAMSDLRNQVIDMFGPAGSGPADQPRLGAGMPPAANDLEIVRELNYAAMNYDRTHRLPPTPATPSPFQAQRYQELVQRYNDERSKVLGDKLLQALQNRAKSIRIYAMPRPDWTPGGAMVAVNPMDRQVFPVDLSTMDPTRFHGPPPLSEVWEAQMQVLVIQDILTAIARANQSNDPQANVLTAPVKQILNLKVYPGYVTGQAVPTLGGAAAAAMPAAAMVGPGGVAALPGFTIINSDDPPGLTGRPSGSKLYDVKHASLSVVVDYQSLPQLFQALAQVNFMTVLKVQVTDVDEYEALRKGFVYGSQDCVRVDLLIESIWFRNWMVLPKGGMPDEFRQGLSIPMAANK